MRAHPPDGAPALRRDGCSPGCGGFGRRASCRRFSRRHEDVKSRSVVLRPVPGGPGRGSEVARCLVEGRLGRASFARPVPPGAPGGGSDAVWSCSAKRRQIRTRRAAAPAFPGRLSLLSILRCFDLPPVPPLMLFPGRSLPGRTGGPGRFRLVRARRIFFSQGFHGCELRGQDAPYGLDELGPSIAACWFRAGLVASGVQARSSRATLRGWPARPRCRAARCALCWPAVAPQWSLDRDLVEAKVAWSIECA